MSITEYLKNAIKHSSVPITAEKARMVAITGTPCTIEKRLNRVIEDINNSIQAKMRYSEFYQLVVIPKDLQNYRDTIINNFSNRGFTVYTMEDSNIFVISWNYE